MVNKRGFTLIELMITVAIIGILAAVAYPSYMDSVRKSRRSDAVAALTRLQVDMERWRANHSSYTNILQGANCGTVNATGLCWARITSDDGYYNIAITAAGANTFTATATAPATSLQFSDIAACHVLTINQNGPVTTTTPTNTAQCWKK